jgi:hypothetical protein
MRLVRCSPYLARPQVVQDIAHDLVQGRFERYQRIEGRTGLVVLPVPEEAGTWVLRGLKLKGLSREVLTGYAKNRLFHRTYPHIGFTPTGAFTYIRSDPSPFGGITMSRAAREFEAALSLVESGCPSIIPLALIELEKKSAEGEPLGLVVSGLTDASPYRGNDLLNVLSTDDRLIAYRASLGREFGIEGSPVDIALGVVATLGRLFAASLRRFSEAGWYRYSGNLGNVAYSRAERRVCMIDLDSCQRLGDCPPEVRSLQVMRDVVSVLYNVAGSLLKPVRVPFLSPELIEKHAVFPRLLGSYYDDLPASTIEAAVAPYTSVVKKTLATLRGMPGDTERQRLFDYLCSDTREVYAEIFSCVYELHSRSRMNARFSVGCTRPLFDARLEQLRKLPVPEPIRSGPPGERCSLPEINL